MTTEDRPEGRGYVDQDGKLEESGAGAAAAERPALIRKMDDVLVSHGYTREAAEAEVDRIGADVYNRAFSGASMEEKKTKLRGLLQLRNGSTLQTVGEMGAALVGVSQKITGALSGRLNGVVKEKRVSKVFPIFDWPRGTRRRKWGILHDQIWFYDRRGPSFWDAIRAYPHEFHTDERGLLMWNDEVLPIADDEGRLWRRHEGAWMRLYMDRRMLWLGRLKFRLHTFHSGDDDSAPHDHPWAFLTFPLADYYETVMLPYIDRSRGHSEYRIVRCVTRWRLHFRRASYAHIVHEPKKPFTTLVVTWGKDRRWGFWPDSKTFVPYDEWTKYV